MRVHKHSKAVLLDPSQHGNNIVHVFVVVFASAYILARSAELEQWMH